MESLCDLTGKVALVTGASRGIGEQIAWGLSRYGASVAIISRDSERCQTVAESIAQSVGRPTIGLALNVASESSVEEGIRQITRALGPIDIVVNNSGVTWGAPWETFPLERWHHVMAVNVGGPFLILREVLSSMANRHYGRIINMASVAGLRGMPREIAEAPAYSASKGAVIALTRDLAVKFGPHGITSNVIAPGFIPTKMSQGVIDEVGSDILKRIPVGRLGTPDDVVGLTVFLASDAASYINGQVIAVDGGALAQWP